ncbi:MAG: hypothetical protein D6719_07085 [Candidatus Dadabacteria bacterium]|nr:MAG: hypothetical protein D6719_07085 [Candidatus Dadabacteria bacterium]
MRVYNAKTGDVLWTSNYNREGNNNDSAADVVVKKGKVFVCGKTRAPSAGGWDWTVRAYRLKDGTLLWEDHYNREGTQADGANALALQGRRLFVVGKSSTTATGDTFTVRSYKAKTGALIWQNLFDADSTDSLDDEAFDVVALGKRLFVVGQSETNASEYGFTVRAYRPRNGNLLWTKEMNQEPDTSGVDIALAVAVSKGLVFVAGESETTAGGVAFTVRAFSARRGTLIWEDRYDPEGSEGDSARALVVKGKKLYVVGETSSALKGDAFTVRAYNARTGAVLWTNRYDRENADQRDQAVAVAIKGRRLFVAGITRTAATNTDFSIRAYSTR